MCVFVLKIHDGAVAAIHLERGAETDGNTDT